MSRVLNVEQHASLMRLAFGQIADQGDWKGPIDCIVPWECANIYVQAIEFMTAVKPNCERVQVDLLGDAARLTCVGYRAGPAGP
jgi:hypothetical protein